MATEVGIREFNSAVSSWIDRVEAGETVVLTRRGRAVAQLLPTGLPQPLAGLLADGRATWSGRRPALPKLIRPQRDGPALSDFVTEDRR